MVYYWEDIRSKILEKHNVPHDNETIFLDLNFKEVKGLLFGA